MKVHDIFDGWLVPVCTECQMGPRVHRVMTYRGDVVHADMTRLNARADERTIYRALTVVAKYVHRGSRAPRWERLYAQGRWVDEQYARRYKRKPRYELSKDARREVLLAAEEEGISLRWTNRKAYSWATLELRRNSPSYRLKYEPSSKSPD